MPGNFVGRIKSAKYRFDLQFLTWDFSCREAQTAMWETWVQSLGWEDPLEEGMETHSSILVWRIPMDRGAWWATVHGVARSWTQLSD